MNSVFTKIYPVFEVHYIQEKTFRSGPRVNGVESQDHRENSVHRHFGSLRRRGGANASGWRRGTGIEPAWNVATRSTLDLKSRPGTSRGNPAMCEDSVPEQEAHVRKNRFDGKNQRWDCSPMAPFGVTSAS